MRYSIKLPQHSSAFIRKLGGWGKYHKWLEANGIARWDSAVQCLVKIPQLSTKKISRNAPCPCDSGKKYKKCCLTKTGGQK